MDTYRKIEAKPSQKIDERFRNFNGMKFQYDHLRYLMTDGEQGLSGNIAKTIAEVAEIYRSEPEKFNEIIKRITYNLSKQIY